MLVALSLLAVLAAAADGLQRLPPTTQAAAASGANWTSIGAPARHQLLFIGASYTAGLGASSPEHGYAGQVAERLGWPAHVYAVPGSGYLNGGPHGGDTFGQQIARIPAGLRPGLVVLQGGRNDAGFPSSALRTAACGTARQLRQKFAGAQLVMLGNIPFGQTVPAAQRLVEHVLATAARSCHVPFIDPIAEGWITRANAGQLVGTVPGHPNDAGYRYIAERLVADLGTLSRHRIGVHTA